MSSQPLTSASADEDAGSTSEIRVLPDFHIARQYMAVKKHSWRGKYKRVFAIGESGVVTRNGSTLQVTNAWRYEDSHDNSTELFADIMPSTKVADEFIITLRKGRKSTQMTFSSEHRAHILTEANKYRHRFAIDSKTKRDIPPVYRAKKWRWSEERVDVLLSVGPAGLRQIDAATQKVLATYYYKDIKEIIQPGDCPGGMAVAYGSQGRLHFFICDKKDELLAQIKEKSVTMIGTIAVNRTLCLTEKCVVERDPASYNVVCARFLADVYALVRDEKDLQRFSIEYISGATRHYTCTERDTLLSSLLDCVRSTGNKSVHVRMAPTDLGQRIGPLDVLVDEEIESVYLRKIGQFDGTLGVTFSQVVADFNTNIDYRGLSFSKTEDKMFAENKSKLILSALDALLRFDIDGKRSIENDKGGHTTREQLVKHSVVVALTDQFLALRRLVASKTGFESFTTMPGFRDRLGKRVIAALKLNNTGVAQAAIDCMSALMQPMHEDYELSFEQSNKSSLLSSKPFMKVLVKLMDHHIRSGTGALVLNSLFDFVTYAVCDPYSDTTSNEHFDNLLEIIATSCGRSLFQLYQHSSLALVKAGGQIMKSMIEEGAPEVAHEIQNGALAECAIIKHLHTAMYTGSGDGRTDVRSLVHRELSRVLVALWTVDNEDAANLLKRIFPAGLLAYLDADGEPPEQELMPSSDMKAPPVHLVKKVTVFDHWKARMGFKKAIAQPQDKQVVLRRRRKNVVALQNWKMLYYQSRQDHAQADLIWNHYTREELRERLETEYASFSADKAATNGVDTAWNYVEFEVVYTSLSNEIKIGDHYLRLLLEESKMNKRAIAQGGIDAEKDTFMRRIHNPVVFFNDLYHRFLLPNTSNMRMKCLQAMTVVYGHCKMNIGPFNDTPHLITMLDKCGDKIERDRLLLFIDALLLHPTNVKLFIDGGGIHTLVDLVTLAHLHTERAPMVWDNSTIEAGENMVRDSEKEWYCTPGGGPDAERKGPLALEEMAQLYTDGAIDENTRCWAQGMEGWKRLGQITQLKWNVMHAGTPFMNETELARLCLSMLKRMSDFFPTRDSTSALIRPLSRVKRIVSDSSHLPHLISLFLTFEPIIVERTAALLSTIVVDNPIMPQLYTTGCFLFCLMYTGSNILPIARLLHVTHNQQATTRGDHGGNPIVEASVLAPLLPAAMILYLDKYGPVKFSEIFLGDNDTPEVIWNRNMRRTLINRISLHLSEYSPRLKSNTQAPYQHCPIASIQYSELQNELFCGRYYLRNLCNMSKYKDWPIDNHIELLRDILHEWQREVEKKPPSLTKQDAMSILGLPKDMVYEESKVRKAYFRMAAKYHPDKNPDPDAREIFDKTAEAYELLCATHQGNVALDGPDHRRIDLIIRSQTILFSRYGDILKPYKYSGYPQLLSTMTIENDDPSLFANPNTLLPASCALAHHTVNTSPLNADELRREGGFEVMSKTFSRVSAMVSPASESTDMPVVVCRDLILFYSAAAAFKDCIAEIKKHKHIVDDVVRCLFCQNAPQLVRASLRCIASFGLDADLQNLLLDAGVLFYLLSLIFEYDVTLTANLDDVLTLDNKVSGTEVERTVVEVADREDEEDEDVNTKTVLEQEVKPDFELKGQAMVNEHARLAVIALAHLGDYSRQSKGNETNKESADTLNESTNHVLRKCLRSLLTNDLCSKLSDPDPTALLRAANMNENSPYLIWNNGTRSELVTYLEEQKEKMRTGDQDPSLGADFEFSQLRDHLRVGNIYVDVYNQTPDYDIRDPDRVAKSLIEYICEPNTQPARTHVHRRIHRNSVAVNNNALRLNGKTEGVLAGEEKCSDPLSVADAKSNIETGDGGDTSVKADENGDLTAAVSVNEHIDEGVGMDVNGDMGVSAGMEKADGVSTSQRKPQHVLQAITALSNIIAHHRGVEVHTIGHFRQLAPYLRVAETSEDGQKNDLGVVLGMLKIFEQVVANKECVNDIAANNLMPSLCLLIPKLESLSDDQPCLQLLEVISVLSSNPKIVVQLRDSGALLYVLLLFTNSHSSATRLAAATFFARLAKDKLNGPKVQLTLAYFLPRIFMDAWKRQPETAITMFDGVHENPELVWTESVREKVRTTVMTMRDEWYGIQMMDETRTWTLPPNFDAIYQELENELVCDGVYVRLYNLQPTWSLRHPRQYLVACFEKFISVCHSDESDSDNLEQLSMAMCNLLRSNSAIADSLASLGYIPELVKTLSTSSDHRTLHATLEILVSASSSTHCVESMGSLKTVAALKRTIENMRASIGLCARALHSMLQKSKMTRPQGVIIAQIVKEKLLTLLLDLLVADDISSSNKALLVQAIKTMMLDDTHGEHIRAELDGHPVWAKYKDQRHDLFISNTPTSNYLTGAPGTMGYLTATANNTARKAVSDTPPPVPISRDSD
eukprot:CFRG8258T1